MIKPNQKKISNIVPDILRRSIVLRLEMEYGNKHYDIPKRCPRCKSKNYAKADWQRRVFCRVIKDDGIKELYVYLKKYRCKDCGHIYASDGPFYPHTCYGSPIVDLVLYLASNQNFDQIERTLMDMGIQLDRDTARGFNTLWQERERVCRHKVVQETYCCKHSSDSLQHRKCEGAEKKCPDESIAT